MDSWLAGYLDSLHRTGRAHDATLTGPLPRLHNMDPATAAFIALLIRVQRSRHVLEIGTSNGYSAIWFADAVRATGGRLTTVEADAERVSLALTNLEAAEVADAVTVVHADGGDLLGAGPDGSVDLLVLDADRPAYPDYWTHIKRVLTPHGVIAVDHALTHAEQLTGFRGLLAADGRFTVATCAVGNGVLTAARSAG